MLKMIIKLLLIVTILTVGIIYFMRFIVFSEVKRAVVVDNNSIEQFYIVKKIETTGFEFVIVGDENGIYDRWLGINIHSNSPTNMFEELKYERIFFEKINSFVCKGYVVQLIDGQETVVLPSELLSNGHINGADILPEMYIENWDIVAPIDREIEIFLPRKHLTKSDFN